MDSLILAQIIATRANGIYRHMSTTCIHTCSFRLIAVKPHTHNDLLWYTYIHTCIWVCGSPRIYIYTDIRGIDWVKHICIPTHKIWVHVHVNLFKIFLICNSQILGLNSIVQTSHGKTWPEQKMKQTKHDCNVTRDDTLHVCVVCVLLTVGYIFANFVKQWFNFKQAGKNYTIKKCSKHNYTIITCTHNHMLHDQTNRQIHWNIYRDNPIIRPQST